MLEKGYVAPMGKNSHKSQLKGMEYLWDLRSGGKTTLKCVLEDRPTHILSESGCHVKG
jgi:hypothetical protein